VAGRFPLYTDNDIRGPLIKALGKQGWDIVRAVDTFPQGTPDDVHFEYAARSSRVFVSNDQPALDIANRWLQEGRFFRMITWPQSHYQRMTDGDIVEEFEAMAKEGDAFGVYPIRHIKPRR